MNERGLLRRFRHRGPVVAVLRLAGVISPGARLRGGLNIAALAGPIERAFGMKRLAAVALVINSPGGSPVQSALVYKRVRAMAADKKIPVFAFAEDVAASGGYWLACAGDEIFADENSIVGSIGVISAGFGFTELLEKIGVERRIHTRGEKKTLLDPFAPEKPEDVARLTALQKEIHESFVALVKERRGDKLKGGAKKLFSGEFWTGAQAMKLGLVDGIGDVRSVMRERYGKRVRLRPIEPRRHLLQRRLAFSLAEGPMAGWADDLMAAVEVREHWGRYGL
jgi:serine protease SohB